MPCELVRQASRGSSTLTNAVQPPISDSASRQVPSPRIAPISTAAPTAGRSKVPLAARLEDRGLPRPARARPRSSRRRYGEPVAERVLAGDLPTGAVDVEDRGTVAAVRQTAPDRCPSARRRTGRSTGSVDGSPDGADERPGARRGRRVRGSEVVDGRGCALGQALGRQHRRHRCRRTVGSSVGVGAASLGGGLRRGRARGDRLARVVVRLVRRRVAAAGGEHEGSGRDCERGEASGAHDGGTLAGRVGLSGDSETRWGHAFHDRQRPRPARPRPLRRHRRPGQPQALPRPLPPGRGGRLPAGLPGHRQRPALPRHRRRVPGHDPHRRSRTGSTTSTRTWPTSSCSRLSFQTSSADDGSDLAAAVKAAEAEHGRRRRVADDVDASSTSPCRRPRCST